MIRADAPNIINCCKKCACRNCYAPDPTQLQNLISRIDLKICEYGTNKICEIRWGYSKGSKSNYDDLLILKGVIERYYKSLIRGYDGCLCPEEVQNLVEKITTLVGNCSLKDYAQGVHVEESIDEDWIFRNTGCLSLEDWERGLYCFYPDLDIKINLREETCLTFDVYSKLTIETANEFLYDLSVKLNEGCEYSVSFSIDSLEKCKTEYNLKIKPIEGCSISFNTYVDLLKCNLSTEIISTILKCGYDINFGAESKKCPFIIMPESTINLCNLDPNFLSKISKKSHGN